MTLTHALPRRAWLRLAAAALLALAAAAPAWAQDGATTAPGISLEQARPLIEQGKAVLFDIRTPQDHASGVIKGARLLPLSQLPQRMSEIPKAPSQPVLLICDTEDCSSRIVQVLQNLGWTNVRYVQGSMSQWAAKGWPMVKP